MRIAIVDSYFVSGSHGRALKLPKRIEQKVQRQNILFAHNRMHYSFEYFQFMRKLLTTNFLYIQPLNDSNQLVCVIDNLIDYCH